MAEEKPKRRRRVADKGRASDEETQSSDEQAGPSDESAEGSDEKAEASDEEAQGSGEDAERSDEKAEGSRPRASGAELAKHARRELAEVTGLQAESVTSLERADDGGWLVTVELLELSRIPDTDDMLGSYKAELDENGELVRYRRLRRYSRSQAGDEQTVKEG